MIQPELIPEQVVDLYFLFVASLAGALIEIRFLRIFLGGRPRRGLTLLSAAAFLILNLLEARLPFARTPPLFFVLRVALLAAMGRRLFSPRDPDRSGQDAPAFAGSSLVNILLAAVIAETVVLLSNCLLCPVFFLLMPMLMARLSPFPVLLLSLAAPLLSLALELFTYGLILRHTRWGPALPGRCAAILSPPVLFLLFIELYISCQIYGNTIIMNNNRIVFPVVNHWQILFIQLFAYCSFFCTLYTCRKLAEAFAEQTRIALMEQEAAAQIEYLREADARYEQTRAFRHDIRSHLTAVFGLLESGDTSGAREYLGKLEQLTDCLSFPCKTGNSVVDILLGSKLNAARQEGICIECTVKIPSLCSVDNLDLCVLFSNAVANAAEAAKRVEAGREKYIRISGRVRGTLFLLEVENSCALAGGYEKGTGFSNMEAVAKKYDGAVTAQMTDGRFYLHVLLVLSRRSEDISAPSY